MSVEAILQTHPRPLVADAGVLARCVDECGECAGHCTICADASLAEDDVRDMERCLRLCLDCADTCVATARSSPARPAPTRRSSTANSRPA